MEENNGSDVKLGFFAKIVQQIIALGKKKIIIYVSVLVVIALGAAGAYYYLGNKNSQLTEDEIRAAAEAAGNIMDSATKGVMPSIGAAANPLTNKPDINPTSKTNPFQ